MRIVIAEFLATALLLAIVVGSGILGERLAAGNEAIVLLANSLATGVGLVALVLAFGPVSGAHMNPAVTIAAAALGQQSWRGVPPRLAAQVVGAVAGVWLAHGMFDLAPFTLSTHTRAGLPLGLGECVATFFLLFVVASVSRTRPDAVPIAVGATVFAGYWFTSSTAFANPAVTLARSLTDTFTGIRWRDVPMFVAGQTAGTLAAVVAARRLLPPSR